MKISIIAFFGLMAHLANTVQAIELTADTYDYETEGKTVLIKFFAPWWVFSSCFMFYLLQLCCTGS